MFVIDVDVMTAASLMFCEFMSSSVDPALLPFAKTSDNVRLPKVAGNTFVLDFKSK